MAFVVVVSVFMFPFVSFSPGSSNMRERSMLLQSSIDLLQTEKGTTVGVVRQAICLGLVLINILKY